MHCDWRAALEDPNEPAWAQLHHTCAPTYVTVPQAPARKAGGAAAAQLPNGAAPTAAPHERGMEELIAENLLANLEIITEAELVGQRSRAVGQKVMIGQAARLSALHKQ
jgi:hypothetical protein